MSRVDVPAEVWDAVYGDEFQELQPSFDPFDMSNEFVSEDGEFFFPEIPGIRVTPILSTQLNGEGARLDTIVARFPRFILSEVNTHRVFSRNSASSRARSLAVTIAEVMEDPVIPLFTANQRGMSGKLLSGEELIRAQNLWMRARDSAVASALTLMTGKSVAPDDVLLGGWRSILDFYKESIYPGGDLSVPTVHKQNANRILEPFMWHEAVISSTEWENFYWLRISEHAQPEIVVLARLVQGALADAPVVTNSLFHDPFAQEMFGLTRLVESAGHAAQVSYRSVLGDVRNTIRVAQSLADNAHYSPFEHPAMHVSVAEKLGIDPDPRNFNEDWVQLRVLAEKGLLDPDSIASLESQLV